MIRQVHLIRMLSPVAVVGGLLVAAFHTATASAADLGTKRAQPAAAASQAPVPSWSGFYAGVQGGYLGTAFKSSGASPNSPALTFAGQNATKSVNSGALGVQAGYNFQSGSLVYGVEGEASFSLNDGKTSTKYLTGDPNAFYAFKGRLGYSFGSTLLYATTGVAIQQATVTSPAVGRVTAGKRDITQAGWLIGAGVEQMLTQSISAKGEIDYAGFGESRMTFPSGSTKVQSGVLSAKVGLNYRF